MGNHDSRGALPRAVPRRTGRPTASSNMRSRIIRCASSSSTRSRSAATAAASARSRAAWLRARLDEAPDRPTLIALHHPPIATGIGWLTEDPERRMDRRGCAASSRAGQHRRDDRRPCPPADHHRLGGHHPDRLPVDRAAGRARPQPDRSRAARRPADDRRRAARLRAPPLGRATSSSPISTPPRTMRSSPATRPSSSRWCGCWRDEKQQARGGRKSSPRPGRHRQPVLILAALLLIQRVPRTRTFCLPTGRVPAPRPRGACRPSPASCRCR